MPVNPLSDLCRTRPHDTHFPPRLPDRLVLNRLALYENPSAHHLAAAHASGPADDLEPRAGVPLGQGAVDAPTALEPGAEQRTGLVFKRCDGSEWGQIRTAFTTAMERAGLEGFRFHDLRHTFASHYMMRGGNLYELKDILGHSDIKMTIRYAHLSPHHLRGGVERLKGLAPRLRRHIAGHKMVNWSPSVP